MNFTEDLQVANKHMKLCSALLMGGIQIRTTVRFHFIPTWQAKITSPVGENVELNTHILLLQMEIDIIMMENILVMP